MSVMQDTPDSWAYKSAIYGSSTCCTKDNSYTRISIGEFMAARTEDMGCLGQVDVSGVSVELIIAHVSNTWFKRFISIQ